MSSANVQRGGCLCGGVRYEYRGGFGAFTLCYCGQCRKAQGGAFVAVLPVEAAGLQLVAGADLLQAYVSSPGKERVFCRVCGAPLFSRRQDLPGVLRLRVGSLDQPPVQAPQAHHFVAAKAPWYPIGDEAPQYPGRAPLE